MGQETQFSPEQLYEQAQGNATALVLGTVAFLKERGVDVGEWSADFGRRVAPGWEELRGQGAHGVMEIVALNFVSVGGSLQSLTGDDNQADAVFEGWPPQEMLDLFNLSQSAAEPFWESLRPIAQYLGFNCDLRRDGTRVTVRFSRQA